MHNANNPLLIPKEPLLTRIVQDIYSRLFTCYGPQHWWPADEPFEVMVGAILTQSTAWINVEKAIGNLKRASVLSPLSLRCLGVGEIAALIKPSGYYNVKAHKLKALVDWLKEYSDDLPGVFTLDAHQLRLELLQVYGIGEETADSILLYAAEKPLFVIDAYTRRIIDRIGISPAKHEYTDYQRLFMNNLASDVGCFSEYHALLVQHGKIACQKHPGCSQCCLREICKVGLSFGTLDARHRDIKNAGKIVRPIIG
jgi:endonuclease III related protein